MSHTFKDARKPDPVNSKPRPIRRQQHRRTRKFVRFALRRFTFTR